MSKKQLTGLIGLALVVVYSLIMVATAGAAASYAWVILAVPAVLAVITARRGRSEEVEEPDV